MHERRHYALAQQPLYDVYLNTDRLAMLVVWSLLHNWSTTCLHIDIGIQLIDAVMPNLDSLKVDREFPILR